MLQETVREEKWSVYLRGAQRVAKGCPSRGDGLSRRGTSKGSRARESVRTGEKQTTSAGAGRGLDEFLRERDAGTT
jgi:hypothetical protein